MAVGLALGEVAWHVWRGVGSTHWSRLGTGWLNLPDWSGRGLFKGKGEGGEGIQASFSWGLYFFFIRHDLERVSGIWEEKTEEWEKARERDGYIAFVFACPLLTAVLFGVCTVGLGEQGGRHRQTELNGIYTAFPTQDLPVPSSTWQQIFQPRTAGWRWVVPRCAMLGTSHLRARGFFT